MCAPEAVLAIDMVKIFVLGGLLVFVLQQLAKNNQKKG